MGIALDSSLEDGRRWLREHWREGVKCPVCTQMVKLYSRKLYSSMAAALIHLYRNFDHNKYVHKSELVKAKKLATTFGGGDFAKLAYWGLIKEQEPSPGEDKRTSGWWIITDKGVQFVERKVKVKSHVLIFNSRFFGFEGRDVSIDDCLGEKWSYSELMGR